MRSTHTNSQRLVCYRLRLAGLTVVSMCLSASIALAQSGRTRQSTVDQETQTNQPGGSTTVTEQPAFVVVTAVPDPFQNNYRFVDPAQVTNLEYEARGSCMVELKKLAGSTIVEDEDVTRHDARKTALAEGNAWVIWMELRWDKPTSARDAAPFRLRYLLFEPGTGRIAASGVGKSMKQTWGVPQPLRTDLTEMVRQAGRDIAHQVVAEVTARKT